MIQSGQHNQTPDLQPQHEASTAAEAAQRIAELQALNGMLSTENAALTAENEELSTLLVHSQTENDSLYRKTDEVAVSDAQKAERIKTLSAEKDRDPKTGLLNAVAFKEKVTKFMQGKQRKSLPDTSNYIIFADLDDFKSWNDFFTDTINDNETLIPAAHTLEQSIREGEGYACRWGGEEFGAFLHGLTHDEVLAFAERLKYRINHLPTDGTPRGIDGLGVSIGIAELTSGDDYDKALDQADKAVKHIKRNVPGKNAIIDYEDISHSSVRYEQPALFEIENLK